MSDDERQRFEEALEALKQAEARIKEQAEQIEKLRREVEEWKRGHRTRRQRFSSGAEGKLRATGVAPGRRLGHAGAKRAVPERIDATEDIATPDTCTCGGCVEATDEDVSTVVEDIVPNEPRNVRVTTKVGRCTRCGKRVVARLPGSSKDGSSVVETQLGARLSSLVIDLRFGQHLPLGRIARYLQDWHGLRVTPGGLSHLVLRNGLKTAASREEIQRRVHDAPVVGADETGMRLSGKGGFAWLARTPDASLFHIDSSRAAHVLDELLPNYRGVLASDFYAVYAARQDLVHAYCGAHLIREAKKIAELAPDKLSKEFADKVAALYRRGEAAKDFESRERVRATFHWLAHENRFRKHPDLRRLQKRMTKHFVGIVAFLDADEIPWNNNATERDLRPLCVHRKVTGGTRSPAGSNALGHWMSVTQTLRKNGIPLVDWLPRALQQARLGRPIPSVFLTS